VLVAFFLTKSAFITGNLYSNPSKGGIAKCAFYMRSFAFHMRSFT